VPGRKTDVNDATWIADLLAHGLIRGSFVPPAPVQDLRQLTRTRKQLVRERASHVQHIDKILQDANLKLGSVITDIMGQSGRAILDAIVQGEHAQVVRGTEAASGAGSSMKTGIPPSSCLINGATGGSSSLASASRPIASSGS
jgi:hypothetical protein